MYSFIINLCFIHTPIKLRIIGCEFFIMCPLFSFWRQIIRRSTFPLFIYRLCSTCFVTQVNKSSIRHPSVCLYAVLLFNGEKWLSVNKMSTVFSEFVGLNSFNEYVEPWLNQIFIVGHRKIEADSISVLVAHPLPRTIVFMYISTVILLWCVMITLWCHEGQLWAI